VHAVPGASILASIISSLDILSSRSALKMLRILSAAPTGPNPASHARRTPRHPAATYMVQMIETTDAEGIQNA